MNALTVILLAAGAVPQLAPPAIKPDCSEYFIHVDFAVINHVRTFSTEYDAWGRPSYKPQVTFWVSFWSWEPRWSPVWGTGKRWLVARGWWTLSGLRSIRATTGGWVLESTDGINVITPEIRFISSPFDWEMRHRRIYRPIRRP